MFPKKRCQGHFLAREPANHQPNGPENVPDTAAPAAFILESPAPLRAEIALFQGANATGWLAIPKGWHLSNAGVGLVGGGNELQFVAPRGAGHGWIVYYNAGVGIGDVLGSAEGLFPGAPSTWWSQPVRPEVSKDERAGARVEHSMKRWLTVGFIALSRSYFDTSSFDTSGERV